MASTIVIGIGTTGLRILEEAQQFHYDFTKKNKPGNNVELIFLDTDIRTKPKRTASGDTSIRQVKFPLENLVVEIQNLKGQKSINSNWIPDENHVSNNLTAAGGMPTYGRLSLWKHENFQSLSSAIRSAYSQVNGDERTNIFVVGSLTGGTGSGTSVDIAYLIRHITGNNNVYGLFLLPGRKSFGTDRILFENTFTALTSIDFYSSTKNSYNVTWPDGSAISESKPPYNMVRYLSMDFEGSRASINSLGELIKVAGTIINLTIFNTNQSVKDTFESTLAARRVDLQGNRIFKNAISNGIFVIQYPKSKIEELLALSISKDLINKLIDKTYFIDKFQNKKDIKSYSVSLKRRTKDFVENTNEKLFELTKSINFEGSTLEESIYSEVDKIIQKTHNKASDKKFFYDLFSTQVGGNFFELIKNNDSLLKDELISNYYDFVAEIVNEFSNLEISILSIHDLISHLDACVSFWIKTYSIPTEDSKWDRYLQSKTDEVFSSLGKFSTVGKKQEYLKSCTNTFINLSTIHICIPILNDLKNKLNYQEQPEISSSGITLPSVQEIEKKMSILKEISTGDGTNNNITLSKRENEIKVELNSQTSCFKMLYSQGTLEREIELIKNEYNKDSEKITLKNLLNRNSIWEILLISQNDLFESILNSSIKKIQLRNYLEKFNLLSIIKSLKNNDLETGTLMSIFQSSEEDARTYVPALVKLESNNYKFQHHDKSKLIIVSSDHKKYKELFTNNTLDKLKENVVDFPELQETIILYQEYGYYGNSSEPFFNPTSQLELIDETKKHIKNSL